MEEEQHSSPTSVFQPETLGFPHINHLNKQKSWASEEKEKSLNLFSNLSPHFAGVCVCVCVCVCARARACTQSYPTLWTVARQVPLSMIFPRQEYWTGLPFPSPGNLPDLGIKPVYLCLLHLQADSLSLSPPGEPFSLPQCHTWASLIAKWVEICLQCRRPRFDPWVRKTLWSRKWQPTPVFLPR